jgi:hypothetical protein
VRELPIGLWALDLCLMTACGTCASVTLNPNTTYKWTHANPDGTTTSGEFTTNEYGQAMYDVPSNVDCGGVRIEEKKTPEIAVEGSAI